MFSQFKSSSILVDYECDTTTISVGLKLSYININIIRTKDDHHIDVKEASLVSQESAKDFKKKIQTRNSRGKESDKNIRDQESLLTM